MATIKAFIERHPVPSYFALVFTISYGAMLPVIGGHSGLPGTPEQVARLTPLAILALMLGPSVAGILLTGVVGGRAGLHTLRARLLRWRVGARWYAVALLAAPLLGTATLAALALISPAFLPGIVTTDDKATMLLAGIAVGLGGGFLEELGWTGFAIPRLRQRHGVLATGLIVGLAWAAWHVPITFWTSGDAAGALVPDLFLPPFLFYVAVLPAFRVLMVWLYERTESLSATMLMHGSLIGTTLFIIVPEAPSAASLVTWYLVLAAVLWLIVIGIAAAEGGPFSRQLLRRRVVAGEQAGG